MGDVRFGRTGQEAEMAAAQRLSGFDLLDPPARSYFAPTKPERRHLGNEFVGGDRMSEEAVDEFEEDADVRLAPDCLLHAS